LFHERALLLAIFDKETDKVNDKDASEMSKLQGQAGSLPH